MLQLDESQVCLEQAQAYWQAQQWQKTIEACTKAIALNQQLPQAYKLMGDALQKTDRVKEAIDYYRQAIALDPNYAEVYANLGTLYAQQEQYDQATAFYQQALKVKPEFTQVYKHLDRVRQLQNQVEQVLVPQIQLDNQKYLSQVNSATTAITFTLDDYLSQGEKLKQQGDLEAALQKYFQAVELSPQRLETYQEIIKLSEQLELWEEAAKYCRLVLQLTNSSSLNTSKTEYLELGQIQYDPKQGAAYHQLGETLSHQELWSDAVVAYRQAIKLKPDFSWSYNNLGYALIQLEQWTEAIPIYNQAIKLKPDFPWSYYNLAEAHSKLHQWSEAITFYQQAVQIQADLPKVQQQLGDAYYNQSLQYREQALKHFQLAIEQDPNDPQAYHQALAIDKNNLDLYLKLGDLLIQTGQLDEGIVIYQIALQIQPKNSDALTRLQTSLLKREPNCDVSQIIKHSLSQAEFQNDQRDFQTMAAELQQTLPHSNFPEVSIIIPVYNQLNYTLKCLKAIALNLTKTTLVEIIVVDDCSTDQTSAILETIPAINLIKHQSNQGFINSCNQGASVAKGKYLYFLNNDTEIQPNCIESLIEVLAQDQQVGAVGSKLLYPQGNLQEAGGIIWQDASGWNYGRNDNPYAPEYNYLREVDYCSGASLMVRKAIFEHLHGFEQNFVPAYYEDTDLCFAIRHQLGLKVMYQPQSEVVHYEGVSSGTSINAGAKRYQVVNAEKFKQKWQTVLKSDGYLPNIGIDNVLLASRKYSGKQTVLVIDSYLPYYDQESGSRRLFEILKIFKSLNYHVIFLPDNGFKAEPYASILQSLQIEVLYTQSGYGKTIETQLNERLSLINFAWVCRPELNEKYATLIRKNQSIKIIYDTIDLHYLRLKRAWELSSDQNPQAAAEWIDMQFKELKMAHQADLTITVTSVEQQILQSQVVDNVAVIPNIHTPYQGNIPGFEEREGILFIGSYNHPPNIDAVLWLCQEIMPLVWQTNPNLRVTLLGSSPTSEVKALASNLITITGYINDLTPYFLSHKLSVSPLRYGAGMKGKIGQSLEYSLPVVSTTIGAEGMNLVPEQHILEANTTEAFAQQILRLEQEADLWNYLAANSQDAIKIFTPEAVKPNIKKIFQQLNQENNK